jgi:hypothetical protein
MTAAISILGFGTLCFLTGAAVIYYQLPVAAPLGQGFAGANQWLGAGAPGIVPPPEPLTVAKDVPGKTCDGLTLVTTTDRPECRLLDMAGKEAHRWALPTDGAWLKRLGDQAPAADSRLHWEQCRLLPDGCLLGVVCGGGDTPYGFALVKLDRNSNVLWALPGKFHHDLDVDEKGRAYLIDYERVEERIPGLEALPSSYQADILVVVSTQGKVENRVSVLKAFQGSPYILPYLSGDLTGAVTGPGMPVPSPRMAPPSVPPGAPVPGPRGKPLLSALPAPEQMMVSSGDVLHTNSVHVLRKEMAEKFPQFKAGQVLLSMRSPSLLAVLDLKKRAIVWAARGPWRTQHSAQFLLNGHILLFDNGGNLQRARVLEYDPRTQAVPWAFKEEDDEPFRVPFRGRCQRLANGNTLVVEPQRWVIEASPANEVVWKLAYPASDVHPARNITGARRYTVAELPFLKGANHARSK